MTCQNAITQAMSDQSMRRHLLNRSPAKLTVNTFELLSQSDQPGADQSLRLFWISFYEQVFTDIDEANYSAPAWTTINHDTTVATSD
jgi:hypothetical protein